MEIRRGRLIDHLHLRTRDLAAAKRFYTAALEPLGIPVTDGVEYFFADELWVDVGEQASHVHFAFQAPDRRAVELFHAAGLKAGGRDNGGPGEREQYHPGYYAAFLFDPDGNNVEAVYHGPHERSADSVVISW